MISYILISFISPFVTQDSHTAIICTKPVIWGHGSMNESASSDFPTTRLCSCSLHSSTPHFKDKHTNRVTWLKGPQPIKQFQTRPTVSYSVHKCETKHANYRKTTCTLLKQQKLPKLTLLLTVKPLLSFSEAVRPNCYSTNTAPFNNKWLYFIWLKPINFIV